MQSPERPAIGMSASDWRAVVRESCIAFEVISDSMRPAFARGDSVLIRPLREGEPLKGQIVAFHRGMLVTHRYLGGNRCRGDNTLTVDHDIREDEIVGIVYAKRAQGRETALARRSGAWLVMRGIRLRLSRWRDFLRGK